ESDRVDLALMGKRNSDGFAGGGIPEARRLVPAAGCDDFVVWAEGDGGNPASMAEWSANRRPGARIPKANVTWYVGFLEKESIRAAIRENWVIPNSSFGGMSHVYDTYPSATSDSSHRRRAQA